MKFKILLTFLLILGLSLTVAAQDDFPEDMLAEGDIEISNPDLVIDIDFSDEDDWEFYEEDTRSVRVDEDDEVYLIEVENTEDSSFLWGQDSREFSDVVIQVDTDQLSREENNGYGIICRAEPDNTGNGYIFYISGDGFVSIFLNNGDDSEFLSEWESSDAINQGRDENTITVVCVGEYLGFYVNGELVAEVEDDTFNEGVVALAASIFEEGEDVEIAFDNLLVWEVEGEGGGGNDSNDSGGRSNTNNNNSSDDVDDLAEEITDMLADGDVEIELDDVLLIEPWDELGDWEELDGDGFSSTLDDDQYVVEETSGKLVWSMNRVEYDDVVMHVEIERLSDGETSAFGMMCRVDPDNISDGYSFVVASDGAYSVGYWDEDGYTPLHDNDFETSSDIDNDDSYEMTVVCVGEYLALYVDGELIYEVEDDTYDEGYSGMAAISFDDDGVEVAFDNLVIWEGKD